jgi:hypothetical protein
MENNFTNQNKKADLSFAEMVSEHYLKGDSSIRSKNQKIYNHDITNLHRQRLVDWMV